MTLCAHVAAGPATLGQNDRSGPRGWHVNNTNDSDDKEAVMTPTSRGRCEKQSNGRKLGRAPAITLPPSQRPASKPGRSAFPQRQTCGKKEENGSLFFSLYGNKYPKPELVTCINSAILYLKPRDGANAVTPYASWFLGREVPLAVPTPGPGEPCTGAVLRGSEPRLITAL